MTTRWRTLALLYPVLDAKYGSGLKRGRARRVMGRDERAAVERVLERLPATVVDWSDGLATLEPLDVIEVRRPIRSLSSSGGGRWWVAPREVREELEQYVAPDRYDSLYALWPGDPGVPQCGWGCTLGPAEATFGAGFSSISTDHWPTLATDPDPPQGYVHEWLHQVEAVYRALGLPESSPPEPARGRRLHLGAPVRRAAVRVLLRASTTTGPARDGRPRGPGRRGTATG